MTSADPPPPPKPSHRAATFVVGALIACVVLISQLALDDATLSRAALVTGVCLVLWLSEIIPAYATTLLLVGAIPLLMGELGPAYSLRQVLGWAADPVLALFLGGFTLSVAATRYGLDAAVARLVLRWSRGKRPRVVALVALGTAALSMWMSNIAAAAMMLAALRPLFAESPKEDPFRKATLLAVAMGANFGGMATPIGTGPNGIAIAAAARFRAISFLDWMALGLPLTLGMVALSVALLLILHKVRGEMPIEGLPEPKAHPGVGWVIALFLVTIAVWLLEPLHHVPAAVVALVTTALFFGTGLLDKRDLARIDWASLILIAGGITLGNLLEQSHLVTHLTEGFALSTAHPTLQLLGITLICALLSALMSNTATSVLFIPLALTVAPMASTPVLIAIACSFGVPFTISTPPNIMAYGEGGISSRDLLIPGLILMVFGCVLVTLTGPWALSWLDGP